MPRTSLRELLSRSPDRTLLIDGGTGSTLEDRGVDVRNPLWSSAALFSAEGRDTTRTLHADFIAAGADIVIANTHNARPGACREFLQDDASVGKVDLPADVQHADEDERADRLLRWIERAGVETAVEAIPADRDVVIAAGIGSEEPWATSTSCTEAEIEASLAPCARHLHDAGAPLILFETVSTAPELAAIAALARDGIGDVAVGLSCGPDGRICGGVPMTDVVRSFEGAPVVALFVQCTRYTIASAALRELVSALEAFELDAAPGVYANDGRVWRDRRWHGERVSPEAYADVADEWRAAGARIIGGCCGTRPDHIAELRRRRREP